MTSNEYAPTFINTPAQLSAQNWIDGGGTLIRSAAAHMKMGQRRIAWAVAGLALLTSGCVPLGSRGSPTPLPAGQTAVDMSIGTTTLRGFTYPNVVLDFRRGLEKHRELSVQLLGPIGVTVSAKAQLRGRGDLSAPALTASIGGGYEYIRSRALLHGGLVQSWQAPSGRLRHVGVQGLYQPPWLMGTWTETRKAYAAGVYFGVQFGDLQSLKVFEIAVYHTENAFEQGKRGILVQPSLTLRGSPRTRRR